MYSKEIKILKITKTITLKKLTNIGFVLHPIRLSLWGNSNTFNNNDLHTISTTHTSIITFD